MHGVAAFVCCSAREKRALDAKLRSTKTLGEASDGEEDDMEAWVERNRRVEEQRAAEAAKKAAAAAAKKARKVRCSPRAHALHRRRSSRRSLPLAGLAVSAPCHEQRAAA